MATNKTSPRGTASIIQFRERVGTAVMGLLLAWLAYMLGLGAWALSQFNSIESATTRLVVAMALAASVVLAATNARGIARLVRAPLRKVINYFTPVLPIDVTSERIAQIKKKMAAVDLRVAEAGALRGGHETEVARLKREQESILREASSAPSGVDDAALARRLNRNQEAVERREALLEEARANEDVLVDAREICEMSILRLEASRERYRATLEVARTVTGVRALAGATSPDDGAQETAEETCMNELAEVDLLMTNLDTALYDRRLGDRVAALKIAELRKAQHGGATKVRVESDEQPERDDLAERGEDRPAQAGPSEPRKSERRGRRR